MLSPLVYRGFWDWRDGDPAFKRELLEPSFWTPRALDSVAGDCGYKESWLLDPTLTQLLTSREVNSKPVRGIKGSWEREGGGVQGWEPKPQHQTEQDLTPSCVAYRLDDLGQVTCPLWAPISSAIRGRKWPYLPPSAVTRRKLDNGQSEPGLWKTGHKWQHYHYFSDPMGPGG